MAIQDIATFVDAAELGSMSAAGRALGVPASTISRRIHRLEDALGVQLVETHARLFRLTEAGDMLLRRCSAAVRDLREAEHALRDGGGLVRGQLRITVPQDLGVSDAMAKLLATFREQTPGVDLLVDLSDRRVDLMAEGVDFAFRVHIGALQAQPSLMARRLASLSAGLYASRAYLRDHGTPAAIEELEQHHLVFPSFGRPWTISNPGTGASHVLGYAAAVMSSSLGFMVPAARADMGIAPIPAVVARASVDRGELVRVLPDWCFPDASVSILWPSSRLPAPRRRSFLDFVVAATAAWSEEK